MYEDVKLAVVELQRLILNRVDQVTEEIKVARDSKDPVEQQLLVGYQNGLVEAMKIAEEYINA